MTDDIPLFRSPQLSRRHEHWLYAIGALLLIPGLGWLIVQYLFASASQFGESYRSSKPWWLRIHGAAAMAFWVAFGAVVPVHIGRALDNRKNRMSGLSLLFTVALLAATAFGLYYTL